MYPAVGTARQQQGTSNEDKQFDALQNIGSTEQNKGMTGDLINYSRNEIKNYYFPSQLI